MLILTALALFSQALYADISDYAGKPIHQILFEPALQPLLSQDLNKKIAMLKVGEPLQPADIRDAIEKLYASGRYSNISVDARIEEGAVTVTFITRNAVFVRDVVVQGVREPPNEGQLVNATKLQLGTAFNQSQVRQSTENLLESLRNNGLYRAKIQVERIYEPATQQVDVVFIVDAGSRAKFQTPIVKGNPGESVEKIVSVTRWKKFFGLLGWREVTESRVQSGLDRVRRSYQKRGLLMARVALDQMEYDEEQNGVTPVIAIDAGQKTEVLTAGAKVSKGKLKDLLPIYQEQSVDKDLLVEGQRNLTEHFESQGYFEAHVDFDIHPGDHGQQVVEYLIERGDRHKLVLVELQGNKYFNQQTLRERMFLQPATLIRFRTGRYSDSYLRRDVNAIKDLYRSNGFRDVDVTFRTEDDYNGKRDDFAVHILISEGPQWFVHNLQLEGVLDEDRQFVEALLHTGEGQPYSDLNISTDQDAILNYYYNNGFPDATFEALVVPAPGVPNQMDVKYTIKEGRRRFVRDVLVSGLEKTNEGLVLDRIQNLEPGQPLSQSSITDSQRRLYDLGIFARVDTALQDPEGDEDYKYVLYRIEEAKKYSLTGGIGAQLGRIGRGSATTFAAPEGTTGFAPRISFGISRSNFLGLGHTISLQTRLSNIQRRALASYLAPQFKGKENLSLTFTGLYDDSRDIRTFNSKRQEGSVQLSQRLSKANTAQYRLTYRRATISSLQILSQLVPLFNQAVQLGIVSGSFIQDKRDDASDAHKGIYNTIDVAYASSILGSRTNFVRSLSRNATYTRIGRDLVFARSTSFGLLSNLTADQVPLSEEFFAGGASSHRGFPENQAGGRDFTSPIVLPCPNNSICPSNLPGANGTSTRTVYGTGFPIGGQALLLNSLELRFPLIGDNLRGVFFHDSGNVYSSLGNISFRMTQRNLQDFDYMVHAVGFGVRYRTPIGPIRLDLAYSINPPSFMGLKGTNEQLLDPKLMGVDWTRQQISHFQFHFSLGQAF
jgi:outer membrane protein assembly complex protein YaeT